MIEVTGDLRELDRLNPHPVYGWMSWVQVLAPSPATFALLEPALADSLRLVKEKWKRWSAG